MKSLTGPAVLNWLPTSGSWYSINNKTDPVQAEIYLFDDIGFGGVSAAEFVQELVGITAPEIRLHLASRGGDVFDGIAVYNALRMHEARITVQVDSLAASIASVIAQAGDERIMVTGSQMMIHDAFGLVVGNAEDMRDFSETLDKQTDNIAAIYAERAGDGRKKSHFRTLMREETFFNATEAVAEGLADSVTKPNTGGTVPASTESADDEETVDVSDFLAAATRIGAT